MQAVEEFDWKRLPPHFAMIMGSMRRSGKTHLLNWVLYQLRDRFDVAFVFSSTSIVQNSFEYIPKNYHWRGLDESVIERMLTQQQACIKRWRLEGKPAHSRPPRVLVVLDDIIADRRLYFSPAITRIFTEGRHSHCSIVLLSQKLVGMTPPVIRSNADCMVFFRQPSHDYRKHIVKNYLSINDDRKAPQAFLDAVWDEKFKALVILVSESQHCTELNQFCYYYLAPADDPPPFQLGHSMFHTARNKIVEKNVTDRTKAQ